MSSNVMAVIEKYGEIIVNTMKKKLQSGYKVATGELVNSLTYKYSYTNGVYNLQITGAKHLINVDRGRRAGATPPPIKPIIAWIKVKRIPVGFNSKMKPTGTARGGSSTLIKKGKAAPSDQKIRGMAIAISKNIGKRGIKPFPILNIGKLVSGSANFKNELKEAIKKDMLIKMKDINK